MSNPIPSSIALTSIAAGSDILSADHRTNYSAVQTATNALITALGGGVAGQLLQAASATAVQWATVGTYLQTPQKYVTLIDIVSSTTETSILQAAGYSIPANTLGAGGVARVTIFGDFLNSKGTTTSGRLKVKLGLTTLFDSGALIAVTSGAARAPWRLQFEIANLTTSSQWMSGLFAIGSRDAPTAGLGYIPDPAISTNTLATNNWLTVPISGTSAEDTTSAKTLAVTWQHDAISASLELRAYASLIEFI